MKGRLLNMSLLLRLKRLEEYAEFINFKGYTVHTVYNDEKIDRSKIVIKEGTELLILRVNVIPKPDYSKLENQVKRNRLDYLILRK